MRGPRSRNPPSRNPPSRGAPSRGPELRGVKVRSGRGPSLRSVRSARGASERSEKRGARSRSPPREPPSRRPPREPPSRRPPPPPSRRPPPRGESRRSSCNTMLLDSRNTRSPGASSARKSSSGVTRVVVGSMPALLVSARTLRRWLSVMRVMTVPVAPARAVRPERCKYALCSSGGSA